MSDRFYGLLEVNSNIGEKVFALLRTGVIVGRRLPRQCIAVHFLRQITLTLRGPSVRALGELERRVRGEDAETKKDGN